MKKIGDRNTCPDLKQANIRIMDSKKLLSKDEVCDIFEINYITRFTRDYTVFFDDMSKINNLLDLYAWFELISSDGVLKGQINHAQFELIQGHYKLHQNRLKNQRPSAVAINQDSIIQTAQTSAIDPEVAEKLEAYVQMLVRGGYPEEQARVHALNHIASFE